MLHLLVYILLIAVGQTHSKGQQSPVNLMEGRIDSQTPTSVSTPFLPLIF